MSKANRAKRYWRDVHQQLLTDAQGRDGLLFRTPEDWLDANAWMPDESADALVASLRAHGVQLWLHAETDNPRWPEGSVRTRMVFPEGTPTPDLELLSMLSKYARCLGKAVARSGDWQPPEGNAFGDTPLPPGGHWEWYGD